MKINKDIENKKELINFNYEKKVGFETLKQEFFKEKQEIMCINTKFLWKLKEKFLNKTHKLHLEKMEKIFKFKYGK